MPLVSIIIPCFNQGKYLSFSVESALAQTHQEIEVIIINDGSTDNTEAVAAKYKTDSRVRYIYQQNKGLCPARIAGVAVSNGQYFQFLDSDDILVSEKIEKQLQILETDRDLAFVYCDIQYIDDSGFLIKEKSDFSITNCKRKLSGNIFDSLFMGGYFPPHTPLVRRSAYERVGGFDPHLSGCGDWDLWLHIAAHGFPAYYLDEKLAFYRIHLNSMSQNIFHMKEDECKVIEKITRLFPERSAREGYTALRQQLDDIFIANKWLNEHRAVLEAECTRLNKIYAELSQHILALDGCPKQVRYPVYVVLLAIKKVCLIMRTLFKR